MGSAMIYDDGLTGECFITIYVSIFQTFLLITAIKSYYTYSVHDEFILVCAF